MNGWPSPAQPPITAGCRVATMAPAWLHWLLPALGTQNRFCAFTPAQKTDVPLVVSRLAAAPKPSPPITWLKVVVLPAVVMRIRVPLSCSPVYATTGLPVAGSPDATE